MHLLCFGAEHSPLGMSPLAGREQVAQLFFHHFSCEAVMLVGFKPVNLQCYSAFQRALTHTAA